MAEFYLVQDLANNVERLVHQGGSHRTFPPDTLLPILKAQKVKLKKEVDEPGIVREFAFTCEIEPGDAVEGETAVFQFPTALLPAEATG